jgi:PKD repeat protein
MSHFSRLAMLVIATLLPLACAVTPSEQPQGARPEIIFENTGGIWQPARGVDHTDRPVIPDGQFYRASGPTLVNMRTLPRAERATPNLQGLEKRGGGRQEAPLPDDVMDMLREEARFLKPNPRIIDVTDETVAAPSAASAVAGSGFPTIDYNQCCGGGGNVPPDPELAAGPNHLIAVVNVAFEIFDTGGNSLGGPTTFASFFSSVPACTGVFDPNANYDESADRFILGIDANGGDYCIAVSQTSDPTGSWWVYSFQTASRRDFFDYPHLGVGDDAVYLGANIFGMVAFKEGRVWAIDKNAMYAGLAPTVVSYSTGSDGTPQPMNLHGWNQGTWPQGEPHYILTDGQSFNGVSYGVWSWNDPFGGNAPVKKPAEVNLNAATGVTAGMPIDAPQAGGGNLQANDFRAQDAEYRNGYIWMSNAQACNKGGGGSENCVRWAQIDPSGPSVVNADVYGSDGEYRSFPDLAVDHCGNMMMGYSKTSASINPGVYAVGRDSTGVVQKEITVKSAETVYVAFDSPPRRWGDYTEMTIAPDGSTFWYLGEYSKNTGNNNGRWGTWINSFTFGCDGGGNKPPVAVINTPVQCSNLDCNFVGSNSTDDKAVTSYAWDFGDGNGSSLADPSHSYAANGTYDVSLTVGDANGASNTAYTSVTVDDGVNNPPNAVIKSIACTGLTCAYDGSGSSDDTGIIAYDWLFGDGATGSGVGPINHTYASAGSYTVRLTVTDDDLASAYTEENIQVSEVTAASSLTVANIFLDTLNQGGGNKSPRATVTITDDLGNAVGSVDVAGQFTGDGDGSDSGTTGAGGTVVLTSPNTKKGKVNFTFCVTSVSDSGSLSWDGGPACANF